MSALSTVHIDLIVFGAAGRMGQRLCALAIDDARFRLVGAIVRDGHRDAEKPCVPGRSCVPLTRASLDAPPARVVIDCSSDAGAQRSLHVARHAGAALLVGTTALKPDTLTALREASEKIPVLVCANTSVGVAVLAGAVRNAAALLGPQYRAGIVESHHAHKKDTPSGTALRLAASARAGGADLPDNQIVALRGGDVVGEHTVRFAGPGEYLEFTHRATSRDVFARGALNAAAWLSGRARGWYTIEHAVGIEPV